MTELGKCFGPGADQEFIDASIQVYRQTYGESSTVWVVDERDRVYVQTKDGPVALGYNHSRAWRGAMTRYSPYFNAGDVEFWSRAMCDAVEAIVAGRKPLPEPALEIENE